MTFSVAELFDLTQTEHAAIFDGCHRAWEALKKIETYLVKVSKQNPPPRFPGASIGERVIIGAGTIIEPGVLIKGPAIIGKNCQIRHNAYIRENVIIGDDCVVGNASELKNVLLFNGAQVPHYNYVGDSILGCKAHLGAGVKISNVKLLPGNARITLGRSPDAAIMFNDRGVSRAHATVEYRGGHFVITDTSSFGTWVYLGGQPDAMVLRRNECFLIGSGQIVLGCDRDEPEAPLIEFSLHLPAQ